MHPLLIPSLKTLSSCAIAPSFAVPQHGALTRAKARCAAMAAPRLAPPARPESLAVPGARHAGRDIL
jgi:hypothetical protein